MAQYRSYTLNHVKQVMDSYVQIDIHFYADSQFLLP